MQSAYGDLKAKASENSENILFIVSDGIETCGGNPVEEAKKLANSDLNVKVNIIGFNVDDAGQKQLKETAAAGNGTYYKKTDRQRVKINF
ncbi:VWA domain-containing protein [Bacillus sp. V3B]|uniref:VWA domain-containing protein n=1 Tax=Bacillus sp. V3B TaxID=2804915 RepID=UPI00210BAA3E|nr:VWA domain-containing protein [Bacillus sp. V3B]MCQ6276050.1 VWA domain-containing protein [Bacillus sp. V3B]